MRLGLAITAAVAVGTLVGCGGGDPGGDGARTPPVPLDVALDADLGVGAPTGPDHPPGTSGLVADYTVTNNADVPVLVVERRPADITPTVDVPLPDTAESSWVYADDSGRVLVTKEMFAPVDADAGAAHRAPAVRLEPGESVTARAFALTPLRRIVPDPDVFVVPGPSAVPAEATSWSFCVQVAPDPGESGPPTMADHTPDRALVCSAAGGRAAAG
ncbi:hypothetical protein [Streptomyces radicis]|uniref:hypothetical protein n=1 Tax=Streptomyces radicis TaxID=1750517 RepID=UPI0016009D10|nr:hypothetical protein [Streptomyces radicis]